MKRAILFDMDGVLLDSMGCHVQAWKQAIKTQLGINLSENYFLVNEGKNSKDIIQEVMRNYKVPADDNTWQKVSDFRDQLFLENFSPKLITGAKELVELVFGLGYQLGVATGSTRIVAEDVMDKTGIHEYFSTLVTSEDVQFSKPHPQPYQKLLNQLDTDTTHAVVIENAPFGVQSALSAGLICLAVTTTNSEDVLSEATIIFSELAGIGKFIQQEYIQSQGKGIWILQHSLLEL
ncbi:MAG TPA: HAD family phosphatase [Anaerolineaceae bacterium]|nr:HAD family phosphatase [Anaerolineaceae bacterium]